MRSQPPTRLVLDGVPRVGFYQSGDQAPEDVPFPSCLAAVVRYLGDDWPWLRLESGGKSWRLNYAHVHFLAVSGMAFGLRWKVGWHPDNVDQMFVTDPSEILRRALAAAGYRYAIISRTPDADAPGSPADEARFREALVGSLRKGVPVLAFGVVGPPECSVVTGYDEGGEVLIGWSFFQSIPPFNTGLGFEPDGQFRKRSWFAETHSLVVLLEKVDRAADLKDTLRHAIQVARQPANPWGAPTGLHAYQAWANQLADEMAVAGQPEEVLRERYEIHHSQVGMLAECRAWAGEFCRYQATLHPENADALVAAADNFQAEHDLMWKVWDAAGGIHSGKAWQEFTKPEVRQAMVALIREAEAHERRAIAHLEAALG